MKTLNIYDLLGFREVLIDAKNFLKREDLTTHMRQVFELRVQDLQKRFTYRTARKSKGYTRFSSFPTKVKDMA